MNFVVVEDNCSDDTVFCIHKLQSEGVPIFILHGNGTLFWCGGMRKGIACAKEMSKHGETADAYLLVNDDVDFYEHSIEKMTELLQDDIIVVGATSDKEKNLSYGGILYTGSGICYEKKGPDYSGECDTFNANCVLIPRDVFLKGPNIDDKYIHTLGDFDYGLELKRYGAHIRMFGEFVGNCNKNGVQDTWADTALSRYERIRRKESPKGAPFGQWFYFLKKNFGFASALMHGFTPYVRILIGK